MCVKGVFASCFPTFFFHSVETQTSFSNGFKLKWTRLFIQFQSMSKIYMMDWGLLYNIPVFFNRTNINLPFIISLVWFSHTQITCKIMCNALILLSQQWPYVLYFLSLFHSFTPSFPFDHLRFVVFLINALISLPIFHLQFHGHIIFYRLHSIFNLSHTHYVENRYSIM